MKRKGFTLVELLVVIAILAILATVSIVGYNSFIKKADLSADEQAITQMNIALQGNEYLQGKSIQEVFKVLEESGINAEDYVPLTVGTYFYWDSNINQVLLVDGNNKVLAPSKYSDVKSNSDDHENGHQWYSLSGVANLGEKTITIPEEKPADTKVDHQYNVQKAADVVALAEYVRTYKTSFTSADTITITLDSDLYLNGSDLSFIDENKNNYAPNVVINGNNHTIYGLYISKNHTGSGMGTDGKSTNSYGGAMFNQVTNLTIKNITIDGAVVGDTTVDQASIFASAVHGTVTIDNVTIKNSTVYAAAKSGLLFGFLTNDAYNAQISNIKIANSYVHTSEGECGLLFGVLTRGISDTTKGTTFKCDVKLSNIDIDGDSKVVVEDNVKTATINGKNYTNLSSKYKQAYSRIGYIGCGQGGFATKTITGQNLEHNGLVSNWKSIAIADKTSVVTITSFDGFTEQ